MWENKNAAVICGEVSVILSVLQTLCHISVRKTASVPGSRAKRSNDSDYVTWFRANSHVFVASTILLLLLSLETCIEKKSPWLSALLTETSVNFPRSLSRILVDTCLDYQVKSGGKHFLKKHKDVNISVWKCLSALFESRNSEPKHSEI